MQIQEKRKIILKKVNEMPEADLSELLEFIQSLEDQKIEIQSHFASEKVLAKDWNKKQEQKVWQNL